MTLQAANPGAQWPVRDVLARNGNGRMLEGPAYESGGQGVRIPPGAPDPRMLWYTSKSASSVSPVGLHPWIQNVGPYALPSGESWRHGDDSGQAVVAAHVALAVNPQPHDGHHFGTLPARGGRVAESRSCTIGAALRPRSAYGRRWRFSG